MLRVTIAGAGVVGLSIALGLAERGVRVTVLDPAPLGLNASAVAAGMLAPVSESISEPSLDQLDLMMAARDHWPDLAARLGINLDRSGAVGVFSPERLALTEQTIKRLGIAGERLTASQLQKVLPGVVPGEACGISIADDWRIDVGLTLIALRGRCLELGVEVERRAATEAEAGHPLVLATGASDGFRDRAPELSSVAPIKGQIAHLALPNLITRVVRTEGAYLVPTGDGLLVGATMEVGRSDLEPDTTEMAPIFAAAARLFPQIGDHEHRVRVGVRASTPDGLPLCGPAGQAGLFLAVGARRNGWLLAPLLARIMVAYLMNEDPGPLARLFEPSRFQRSA